MHMQRQPGADVRWRAYRAGTVAVLSDVDVAASEDAWDELFEALPRGWMVGRPPRDSRSPSHRLYAFKRRARGRDDSNLSVRAWSEEEALRDLTRKLREKAASRRS